jgi:phospholipid/cholesterol/gamma-HCH transport system substrate-binding protein
VKISKEAKVGLLALVSGVVLYLGFNFLKGVDFFSPNNRYFVVYDNVDGLTVSNPVMLNGYAVGRVRNITLLPHRGNHWLVSIDVSSEIGLGDSTLAVLADSDLLGGKTIALDIRRGNRSLATGDTLIGTKEQGLTTILKEKTLPVIDALDSTMVSLNRLVREFEGAGTKINGTLTNLQQTSAALESTIQANQANLGQITSNFSRLSSTLADPVVGMQPMLEKMNTFADSLNQMELAKAVENANQSIANLNEVLAKINDGQGSLGRLVKDDSLYSNLNRTAADLDRLFIDVRQNPRRYINFSVFGGGRKNREEGREPKEK